MNILVTGGAGFIGSELIRQLICETDHNVLNFDKLTYAGNLESLKSIENSEKYTFIKGDITNHQDVEKVFTEFKPSAIMHLAAESHVDRSIDGPAEFINTNVFGTFNLLNNAKKYWENLTVENKNTFRFHHISTDEVYGTLGETGLFKETTPYSPNSPYSASKASSDHLVRAWHETYGLPILITNCSNNYGPYHFPEKLIPLIILNSLAGKKLPIYGKGDQIRDWLYVADHANALRCVLEKGDIGETYNIGGHNELQNIEVVKTICNILDEIKPHPEIKDRKTLIEHVTDRPGHDKRYAIDASKIQKELDWKPKETFESGLRKTIEWYLENEQWWQNILNGNYQLERLGLNK